MSTEVDVYRAVLQILVRQSPKDIAEMCHRALVEGDKLATSEHALIPVKEAPPALADIPLEHLQMELRRRYPIGVAMAWSQHTPTLGVSGSAPGLAYSAPIQSKVWASGSIVEQLGLAAFLDVSIRANMKIQV